MSGRRATDWTTTVRVRVDGWPGFLLLLAMACAGFLVLGVAAPGGIARTSWLDGRGHTVLTDSNAGYVALVSLCGLVAFATLLVAAWSWRARLPAVFLAAAVFACAAWVAVRYQLRLNQGVMGLEGRLDTTGWSDGYAVQPPALLPLLVLVAIAGALLALLHALVWWPRRTEREHV